MFKELKNLISEIRQASKKSRVVRGKKAAKAQKKKAKLKRKSR